MKHETRKLNIVSGFTLNGEFLRFYNHTPITVASNECGIHDFSQRLAHTNVRTQEQYTLHFVLRGKGVFTLADKSFSLKENDIFITMPNVKVSTVPDEQEPWKYFWIGFNGTGAQEIIQSARFSLSSPTYSCTACAEQIRTLAEELLNLNSTPLECVRLHALSATFRIFALISQERKGNGDEETYRFSREIYLQKTIDYLEANFRKSDLSIEEVCNQLAVSHSYLCRVFKQLSGITISQYLTQLRMREARVLLEIGDMKIETIAHQLGYNEYAYFSKTFKEIFAITPSQYRKMMHSK